MNVGTAATSVFDADLPTLVYDVEEAPAQVYPRLQEAQRQAPVALGPHVTEVLSYSMVRSILRDTRFQIPPGINLLVQGITSGPLWDKVVNSLLCLEGDPHHRLRSLTSKAFTPRAISASARHDGHGDGRVGRSGRRRGHTATSSPTSRAPTPSPSSARCWAHPARIGSSFRCGRTMSSKPSASASTCARWNRTSCARGGSSTTTSTTWLPGAGTASPTICCPA